MDKQLLSIHEVSKLLNVTPQTLRNWDKNKKLVPYKKGVSGYRYYSYNQLQHFLHKPKERKIIGYCRVSSLKQKDDLERQIENVKMYMIAKGYSFDIIYDIGSGINYKKLGFKKLINLVVNNEVDRIVVLYKDRLLRFGYEVIEYLCELYNCTIEIIDSNEKSKEQELVEDLIQIITVFSCRLQGKRSKITKEIIKSLKNE